MRWQLAGDEFAPDNPLALMATGFLAAGVHSTQITKNEVEKHRYDELDDMLATTGTAMLGLTVGCARCHDHKFDPIPQADYYRMLVDVHDHGPQRGEHRRRPGGLPQGEGGVRRGARPARRRRWPTYEAKELPGRFAEWEKTQAGKPVPPTWVIAEHRRRASPPDGATLTQQGRRLRPGRRHEPAARDADVHHSKPT